MRFLSLFLIFFSLLSSVLSAPHETIADHYLQHYSNSPLSTFDRLSPVYLTLALQQSNVVEAGDFLLDLANPASPNYAHWWSHEKVNDFLKPKQESIDAVYAWLNGYGISSSSIVASPNSDFLSFTVPVGLAEFLLDTEYQMFKHKQSGATFLRCREYFLPEHLQDVIATVGPTVRLPNPRLPYKKTPASARKNPLATVAACQYGVTPECLNTIYNITNLPPAHVNNSVAVTGFLEQFIALPDLQTFFQNYAPQLIKNTPKIIGDNQAGTPGMEASLDIQYAMGVAQNISATFYSTAGRQPGNGDNEPFLVFLQTLASEKNAPWVISSSYGDDESMVRVKYAERVSVEFLKAGLRGISLLFSSGDSGTDTSGGGNCTGGKFDATFPATSPWVTAIGGTTGWAPETASIDFQSGGGFSAIFPQPKYQQAAVSGYLNNHGKPLPPPSFYNANGRGFPDLASQSENFQVVQSGSTISLMGTSCSSPSVAGIIALLNNIRFQAGKPSLGFLNPFIYANGASFNDVLIGNNAGCSQGFNASIGWDPLTGFGSISYIKTGKIVQNLP